MTIEDLKAQGMAEFNDIKPFIKFTINHGMNSFGLIDKTLVLVNGSLWDYIPEDELYELNSKTTIIVEKHI